MADEIDNTLEDRGKSYGDFGKMSATAQQLKRVMREGDKFDGMAVYQKEALDLIATKIARIVDGDPYHEDSWHDIVGYATLAHDRVRAEQPDKRPPKPPPLAANVQMPIIKKQCRCNDPFFEECPIHGSKGHGG